MTHWQSLYGGLRYRVNDADPGNGWYPTGYVADTVLVPVTPDVDEELADLAELASQRGWELGPEEPDEPEGAADEIRFPEPRQGASVPLT